MIMTDIPIIQSFIRMCADGWQQGWHERNGGNLTYRMTKDEVHQCHILFEKPGEWTEMGVCDENMAGEFFITTGSGKYFRNIDLDNPNSVGANIGIVEINKNGDAWRIAWGLENNSRPTSEFPTHFMNHAVRKTVTNGQNRVIYHAHPANIIAMTYIMPLTAKDFTLALWRSATECPVVFPDGVGVVPWFVPGGAEIALATSKVMVNYSAAVWAHHGLFCSGVNFDETFGLMHTIEKAAEIYIKVLSSGLPVKQTITNDNLKAIAKAFGVELNKEFL